MIWHYNRHCELYQWSDNAESYFVLNALSGQTHVLNQLALDALDLLKHQAIDEEGICNQLAGLYENFDSDDAEIHQHVLDMLSSLDELGLIEPCSV